MPRFEGRVLLATGAGSGIGAAVADRFSAEGGTVAVVDRNIHAAQAVAGRVGGLALQCDVANEIQVRRTVERAADDLGGIDYLLNGAGYGRLAALEDWSFQDWTAMIAVHVGGAFLFTKYALPYLRRSPGASIVNIASISSTVAQEGNVVYGTAKAALIGFTRQLSAELAPHIRVNAVSPGKILTGLTQAKITERGGGDLDAGLALAGKLNPFNRIGRADEVAASICYLLSEDSSFVTGTELFVDGGEIVT